MSRLLEPPSGVRQYGNAVTSAALLFGDTGRQAIRRELVQVSETAAFQKSPHFPLPRQTFGLPPPGRRGFLSARPHIQPPILEFSGPVTNGNGGVPTADLR